MTQFAVLHIEKSKSGNTGVGNHIERKYVPKNADPEKQHLNFHFIKTSNTLNKDVNNRIAAAVKKTPRKDAVKSLHIFLGGSHERMKEIEKDPKLLNAWIKSNMEFIQDKFGKENIMRFSLHRDEITPHIHAVVTPISKDGRLSAKEFLLKNSKKGINKLQEYQEDYGKKMQGYGLQRGLKGSTATHDSVKEYYAKIANPVFSEINAVKETTLFGKEKGYKVDIPVLDEYMVTTSGYKKQVDRMKVQLQEKDDKIVTQRKIAETNQKYNIRRAQEEMKNKLNKALAERKLTINNNGEVKDLTVKPTIIKKKKKGLSF